ncbi:MAG: hypothetical protein A3D24_04975 [Candidatus Blackburnbacteria bacterium RIFCSPHIGHO2_02_FULL_39_13]|uniref:Antitoxin n=1 Tax=Candidatus Blackburnbacteria bacterium RIFCSPLOWO2_01_FULL_40_20 TaxID=1797519 RepID=A0A1G1VB89_9BACT|nr:MAG: Prevent-host-death family protein [Microgenomates group bacterium GW2011_GWA2_39_19]OGY07137.1 MAG: hypothetical protein A2694_03645 [Candidatus Blackburnbacteria bacterium RIFCSPHIGHO2_01_FULL_40_17]OGY08959.1 MAG: hypothetical protein A3D24_04975 [Candidatus Blackburnbacteria bacterium RIFCSPHIGHO2_02_FULL_39_13]OGY12695.1 MAG: hypothetical protein A3A77_00170 [Candidatus Blackburnbacteria bacterium RIFCSPLOWO2_01_FULL_40_20]OGY15655.1 MAG: hypothetical protein A3I52_02965 [Candidatus
MTDIISITTLKQNTADVIKKVKSEPVVVVQRSEPAAVLVHPDHFKVLERALQDLEDLEDMIAVEERKNEPRVPFEVVKKKLFGKKK